MASSTETMQSTLNLSERAKLAINAITRCTNEENDYACWFYVNLYRNPPTAHRQLHLYGKFMEGLVLTRRMTDSHQNTHVDQVWHDKFLEMLRDRKPVLDGPEGGRQLAWLAAKWEDTGDSMYKDEGERAIQRGLAAAVHRDDYCYFGSPDPAQMPAGWPATGMGWTIQGLAQFYDATGSEAALEHLNRLARFVKDHSKIFDAQGHFLARHDSSQGPALHFHHNCNALEGLSEYAHVTANAEFGEFVRMGYEYAKATGSPLVGFFPEYIDDWPDKRGFIDCEACCVADMVQIAMRLSLAGVHDYWDDVDRYMRNQFAEMQMTSSDWIYRMVEGTKVTPVGPEEIGDQVPERNVGAFAGWAPPNDFYGDEQPGIQHCCTGNCARTLFHVWDNMIARTDRDLRLHLLLNRESDLANVRSEIPFNGLVSIDVKQPVGTVAIRAPEWVDTGSPRLYGEVNGRRLDLSWDGRYARMSGVTTGDNVTFRFPIENRNVQERIGEVDYKLVVRGNNVVSMSPGGVNYPFYQYDLA